MKLFLVERRKEWFEQYKSFVVAARDEEEARRLAYAASFPQWWDDEDRRRLLAGAMPDYAWIDEFLDRDKCSCSEITLPDEPAIIHSHYTGG
jgi:hypothetical protein